MKVLHICQKDDIAGGGAVRVAFELLKRQASIGVDAKCVFVYGEAGSFGAELPGRCLYVQSDGSISKWTAAWRLWQIVNRDNPDVIHHHDGITWTHGVSLLSGRLVVGHGHLTAPQSNAVLKHKITGWVHLRTYLHFFAVSGNVAESWIQKGYPKDQIEVVPNGVDSQVFYPVSIEEKNQKRAQFGIPVNAVVFCFVGRLHNEVKHCDDFLRAIAASPENVIGLIAGTGPDEKNLQDLAVALKIDHRVFFAGLLENPASCYQASDVFLMTSSYEQFGLVVLEATSCGLPVASFPCDGGVGELLAFVNAAMTGIRDPAELSQKALSKLAAEATDPEIREATRGAVVERYSWDKLVDKIVSTYSKLLGC